VISVTLNLFGVFQTIKDAKAKIVLELYALKGNRDNVPIGGVITDKRYFDQLVNQRFRCK
jgi:hypothetical protein